MMRDQPRGDEPWCDEPRRDADAAPGNARPATGPAAPLRVLCVTPFGPAGRGGVDRLYAYLRGAPGRMAGLDLRFASARGSAKGMLWVATLPVVLARLAAELHRFRPHVVHINFSTGGSLPRKWAVLHLARAAGARVVVHFHGEFIAGAVAAGTPQGRLFRAIATGADRVIALGAVHAAAFEGIGVAPGRIAILPNATPDFAPGSPLPEPRGGPLRLLFAGLMTENKGPHLLLAALARLAAAGVDVQAVMAGNGAVAEHRAMAAAAGLDARVSFPGWVDAATLHGLMREADIVVLPSRTEALPLSLIEGACAGAALVATDVGNVRAILHEGVNGLLVPRTPEGLFAALDRLAADPAGLAAMQAASRQVYLAGFTLDAFAAGLARIYRDCATAERAR